MAEKCKDCHVLIVEDNPSDALLAKLALEEADIKSEHVRSADDAIRRLFTGGIDLCVLDLNLPDTEGGVHTVVKMLDSSDVPIVVMTGDDESRLAEIACLKIGAVEFVRKSQISTRLAPAVTIAINRNREKDAIAEKYKAIEQDIAERKSEVAETAIERKAEKVAIELEKKAERVADALTPPPTTR